MMGARERTPKAFANFSPALRAVSALPWELSRGLYATLKGLRNRLVATGIDLRTPSEFALLKMTFVPRRCPGLKFANAFGVYRLTSSPCL